MALGITQAGNRIGMFIFSALNGYLVSKYGLQGSFLLLAAISLHTIPLGLLIREPLHEKSQDANLKPDSQELHSMSQNYETLGDNNKINDSNGEAYKEELVANSETTSLTNDETCPKKQDYKYQNHTIYFLSWFRPF